MTDIEYKEKYNAMLGHMALAKIEMDKALEIHEDIGTSPLDDTEKSIYRGVLIKQVVYPLQQMYNRFMSEFDIVEILKRKD